MNLPDLTGVCRVVLAIGPVRRSHPNLGLPGLVPPPRLVSSGNGDKVGS
jgi:hypothetical protein